MPRLFAGARAVLMDIDGTLLDSAESQTQCWLHVLRDFGYAVDYQQVRARIGMGPDRVLRELCGISEASARARRLRPIREMRFRCHDLPQVRTFPNAREFVRQVQDSGARLGIVTSAYRSEALALLGAAQLLTDFDHVVCREDVAQTKPSADGVLVALDRLGMRPEQAVLIASSPFDLAAAHAARVPCVALRSGGWPESALLGGRFAYADLSDLLAHWQDSSQARSACRLSAPPSFMWRDPPAVARPAPHPSTSGPA